jgi:multiple sugar transport system permease protein
MLIGLRFFRPLGFDPARNLNQIGMTAGQAAVFLLVSWPLLGAPQLLSVPLIWPMMPFWGWLAAVGVMMALFRGAQAYMATGADEARIPLRSAAGWLLTAILGAAIFRLDPKNHLTILEGEIKLTWTSIAALLVLGIGAVVAMAASARYAAVRGATKKTITHLALIVGSIVFGLPFVWLAITSFKEDRDMSSPNGLVWIPKVQETRQYLDKDNPLLEGKYKGITIQATIEQKNTDGTVQVNVVHPQSIAGSMFTAPRDSFKEVAKEVQVVTAKYNGVPIKGMDIEDQSDGRMRIRILEPSDLAGKEFVALPADTEPVRHMGLKWQNYPGALEFLPPEANYGLTYLSNTLMLVVLSVVGTLLSSSIVAYAFSRMRFPGREQLFFLMISTMMLPAAVTMLPQFLIFRDLGWIDSLKPLWVPAFFGSAFNIFLLRQFFLNIPMELEDAAKIDGCSYLRAFWSVMVPQIQPALAVIGIWTFMAAWNNFMGPLIYVSSPEHMTISYAVQMYNTDRGGEPGLLMAFTTMAMLPVLALFFFAQRYFIEGVTLSGLGGR